MGTWKVAEHELSSLRFLTPNTTKSIVHAFVTSLINCYNFLLVAKTGICPEKAPICLQLFRKARANVDKD